MNIYVVGGAIAMRLLGVPVQGSRLRGGRSATPEQMVAHGLPAGRQGLPCVPASHTHEEYALARTERKTGGRLSRFQFFYAPDVTLEEEKKK